jgi:choline dehydrogenase-like flavoprotein
MRKQFRTPQLLMVSGIGPQATLSGLDIPVVADLPGVGQDFWVRFAHTFSAASISEYMLTQCVHSG